MDQSGAYFRRVNRPLLELLPPGLDAVLDLGCAAGALGAAYKQRHPATRWVGVELDPAAAAAAQGALDHVVCGDAETLAAGSLPLAPFDALVYADSLEHFRDPAAALAAHLKALRPGGTVCVSLPNVQHWSAVIDLIGGRWDYRDAGLFDRTHLRFFTLDTILDLLRAAGGTVEAARPLVPAPGASLIRGWERHDAVMAELESLCARFGLPFDARRFNAYQYVLRARFDGGPS